MEASDNRVKNHKNLKFVYYDAEFLVCVQNQELVKVGVFRGNYLSGYRLS